jgi:hypothetical protein
MSSSQRLILIVALYAGFVVSFHLVVGVRVPQFFTLRDAHHIGDFAYHVLLVRGFWFEDHVGIYRFQVQREMLNQLFAANNDHAMPPAVLPTFLIVYYPFALVALRSISFAYSWWVSTWLFVMGAVLWKFRPAELVRSQKPFLLLLAAIVLSSDVFYRTVVLGQTSLCAVSLLVILYRMTARPTDDATVSTAALGCLLVLVLSMKPPYLVMSLTVLFAHRRWSVLTGAILLVVVTLLLLTVKLGAQWPMEYVSSAANHVGFTIAEEYRPSLVGPTMNVFRHAFAELLGAPAAGRISLILFAVGWLALCARLLRSIRYEESNDGVALSLVCWSIALFLLLAPYSGIYEDLLIVAILILLPVAHAISVAQAASVGVALFLVLNFVPWRDLLWPEILWITKAALLVSLARVARRSATVPGSSEWGNERQVPPAAQREATVSAFGPSLRTMTCAVSSR